MRTKVSRSSPPAPSCFSQGSLQLSNPFARTGLAGGFTVRPAQLIVIAHPCQGLLSLLLGSESLAVFSFKQLEATSERR